MNDHCHKNRRIRHVLTGQDLESWVACSALNFGWQWNTQIRIKPKPLNLKTKDLELRDKTSYTQISKEGTNNEHTREFRVVPKLGTSSIVHYCILRWVGASLWPIWLQYIWNPVLSVVFVLWTGLVQFVLCGLFGSAWFAVVRFGVVGWWNLAVWFFIL